ncbi:hypothetical protein QBC38DRAFT_476266 [Podospora fimiseda]|uniref:Uncharacterized protein n=1 Tax=Podospora fimiseda TaxID=252190 RepID=A0AAN7BR03_9PEZI|nr:hypothetical protein QBC38DRAFT_476266 [Podospora fimiseda]
MLGKIIGKINSQTGEDAKYIVLEQWHVDVIFSFQRELSQSREKWEDMMDLGKRLFALLLGEQRRQEGKIDRGRRLKDGRYPEDLV